VHDRSRKARIGPPLLPSETPEIRAIAHAYDLLATWPRRPDYLDHLLAVGRVVVARHAGRVVGYGGAFAGPGQTHLTDLFVRPDATSRGLGGAIVGTLELDPAKTTVFSSSDPRAKKLYRRLGLREVDELSYLVGGSSEVERLRRRLGVPPASACSHSEAAIERHLELRGGLHRGASASFLADSAEPYVWAAGYAWLRVADDRVCVGPIGSNDQATSPLVVADALLEAIRLRPAVQLLVAHRHPAHGALVASGFTTASVDTFMAADRSLIDMTRYCPDPDLG